MLSLPPELIIEILSYLDVHDRLLFIEAFPKTDFLLSHPKLWVHVDLQRVYWINLELLDLLARNASSIQNIVLNNPDYLLTYRSELREVMCTMTNVVYLDVSMCNLMEKMDFLVHMRSLKHVVLDCLPIVTTDSFLPTCTSIQTLSMKGNSYLTMSEVTDICKQLVNLRFLDTQGTCDFMPGNVSQILSHCPNLHTFLFNSFYYSRMYSQWIELVNITYPHVTFHYTTYQQIKRFEKLLSQEIAL